MREESQTYRTANKIMTYAQGYPRLQIVQKLRAFEASRLERTIVGGENGTLAGEVEEVRRCR